MIWFAFMVTVIAALVAVVGFAPPSEDYRTLTEDFDELRSKRKSPTLPVKDR